MADLKIIITHDTFTDSNGTNLQDHTSDSGHDWIKRDLMGGDNFAIQGNAVSFANDPTVFALFTGYNIDVPPTSDYYEAQVTAKVNRGSAPGPGDSVRVYVRRNSDPSIDEFYALSLGGNAVRLLGPPGEGSPLETNMSFALSDDTFATIRLRTYLDTNGDVVLEGYVNDVLAVSHTDSSGGKIDARGQAGIGCSIGEIGGSRTVTWDDFELSTPHLSGSGSLDIQGQGLVSLDHEFEGQAQVEIGGTGTIAGGLAVLEGEAGVSVQGAGEIRGLAALEGQSQVAVQGAGSIIISDYNFRWSIEFLEARSDHGYPTVYAEVNSSEMPSGAFPEGNFFERRLLEMPRLEEAEFGERFGISGFQRVSLALDNSDGLISSLDLTDAYVRLFFVSEAGDVREWKGRVTEWTLSHRCVVSVEDMDAVALTEELPRRTLNDIVEAEKVADSGFDEVVVANDLGRAVPVIFGRSVKVPLLYIKADESEREYDYIIGEGEGLGGGNFPSTTNATCPVSF